MRLTIEALRFDTEAAYARISSAFLLIVVPVQFVAIVNLTKEKLVSRYLLVLPVPAEVN